MSFFRLLMVMITNLVAVQAMAEGHDPSEHHINWWGLGSEYSDSPAVGWLIITFLIFIYALARAIKKPLALYLETRSKDIEHKIQEGQRAQLDSEAKLRLYEQKLNTLGDEIHKMKAAFDEQAQREKEEKERHLKELEERIRREAEDTIRAEYGRSKNRLSKETIAQAISLAQQNIMDGKVDQVDDFLKKSLLQDLNQTAGEVHR